MRWVRQTSIDAYTRIKELGLLKGLQWEVYSILYDHGPLTQGELWNRFFPEKQRHTIAPRFAELRRRGAITEVGQRPCGYSGVNAYAWDVTSNVPEIDEPHLSLKQRRKNELRELITTGISRLGEVHPSQAQVKVFLEKIREKVEHI